MNLGALRALGPKAMDLGAAIASLGPATPLIRESARKNLTPKSTHYSFNKLDNAFDRHLDDIKPGASLGYGVYENIPTGESFVDRAKQVMNDPLSYAGSTAPGETPGININPRADRAMYAHELGHLASQQTDVGHLAASLRHNPGLKKAMLGSLLVLPGIQAAVEAGDDDMDSALAVAALASAPTLIDEGLATRHGLAMLDKGGMRASLGQRGKLAGGLLSYLSVPILAAAAGNLVGNQLDSDI